MYTPFPAELCTPIQYDISVTHTNTIPATVKHAIADTHCEKGDGTVTLFTPELLGIGPGPYGLESGRGLFGTGAEVDASSAGFVDEACGSKVVVLLTLVLLLLLSSTELVASGSEVVLGAEENASSVVDTTGSFDVKAGGGTRVVVVVVVVVVAVTAGGGGCMFVTSVVVVGFTG